MRKLLFMITIFCMVSTVGFAQKSSQKAKWWGIGLNIGYGTSMHVEYQAGYETATINASKPFLGVKAYYDITEVFTIAASFNRYFKKTVDLGEEFGLTDMEIKGKVKFWDINADLHWNIFNRIGNFRFYPLAGLTYLHGKASAEVSGVTDSTSEGKFGVNLGIGGQFDLNNDWAISVEAKYQIISGAQFVPMATLMYRL